MALEDDLRSLFADDRLDLAVKPGADTEIVTGARRVRRRRTAVTTAFVLALFGAGGVAIANFGGPRELPPASSASLTTSVPSSSVALPPTVVVTETHTMTVTVNEPPPASSNAPAGPAGYGKLKLGMPEKDALASGVLVQPSTKAFGTCTSYRSESVSVDDAVMISPTRGVVRISLPAFAKTSTGIGAGSSVADVKAKYPAAAQQESAFVADMGDWRYVFTVDAEKVGSIRMELKKTDC